MGTKRTAVLAATIVGSALFVAPATAMAEVDPGSLADAAEIVAIASDGGGGSEDRDRSGRIGFSEFVRTVSARDSNSDSGRVARAHAFQDSKVVEDGDELYGLDSQGFVSASFADPDDDPGTEPNAQGDSEVDFSFEVVGSPVNFSLTGSLSDSFTPTNSQGPRVLVVSPSGVNHESGLTSEIDETGQLQPGTHTFSIDARAPAFNPLQSSGEAEAAYDLQLRFCTIVVNEPNAITLGGSGDNVICGTPGADTIDGQGGADRIFGLGGNDTLAGGPGSDKIDGGEGSEAQILGGTGNDTIDAGPGDDGPGDPTSQVVAGGPGDDQIDGGPGVDRIFGRCGETVLGDFGMCPGNPVVPGEAEDDNLLGGLGNDFLFGDAGTDFIAGGAGTDLVHGDAGGDTVEGGTGGDSLDGGEGPDQLFGGGGGDVLLGAGAGDCLVGGPSRDELFGGANDDKLLAKDGSKDTGSGGGGPDRGRFDQADVVASVGDRSFQGGC